MMLYLTGAQSSLNKSLENPQSDPSKSLGGYISSTPVPNGGLNTIFDTISSFTLNKKDVETIGIALINKFDSPVKNVEIKLISDKNNYADFKVAAVEVDKNNPTVEHISNRYQLPMQAEFHNVSFERASVEVQIISPAVQGEEILLLPFNVTIISKGNSIDDTWNAFVEGFSANDTYSVSKVTDEVFKIARIDEQILSKGLECSYISSDNVFNAEFNGEFKNGLTNSATISDKLESGGIIGLWIQRKIKDYIQVGESKEEEITLKVSYELDN